MMNWMTFARVGKTVALLAFLMPWLVVSCQGTPIATATGIDLAFGTMKTMGEQGGQDASPQLWAVLALLLIIGGLIASFTLTPVRKAVMATGGAAAAALVLCIFGMMLTVGEGKAKISRQQGGGDAFSNGMQQAAAQGIRFETRFGYWLTLLALAGASGSAFMLYRDRPFPGAVTRLGESLRTAAAGAGGTGTGPKAADPDSAYWDAMTDKTDLEALEEYVYRFPEGRFVGLARERLARRASPDA